MVIGGLVLIVVDDLEVATRHGSRARLENLLEQLLRARSFTASAGTILPNGGFLQGPFGRAFWPEMATD